MAKGTKNKKDQDEASIDEISVEIKSASLKGDFLSYNYELQNGPTRGDDISRTGSSIVHEDLKKVFKRLHVHLAVACEEIDPKIIKDVDAIEEWDVDNITKKLTTEEHVSKRVDSFSVSSFKCSGTGDNEGVSIVGHKRLSTGEYVKMESPRVSWNSDYHFINELRVVIDDVREEVQLYMNGKAAPKMVQTELNLGGEDDDNPDLGDDE